MDPLTIGLLGLGVFGSFLGASAERRAAEAQADDLLFNADQLDFQSNLVQANTDMQERRTKIANAKALGSIRVAFGASGLSGGNEGDILREERARAKENEFLIKHAGMLQIADLRRQAKFNRGQAESVRKSGRVSSIGTFASGTANILSRVV